MEKSKKVNSISNLIDKIKQRIQTKLLESSILIELY